VFEAGCGQLDHPHVGRPGLPIRLMVGLRYLQHTFLFDEEVVACWVENPYRRDFCGFDYLQLALPIGPSSLVCWRQPIGQDGTELLLQETIAAAARGEAVKPHSLERVCGTAVQRCDVDCGYRGHRIGGQTQIFVVGARRGITPSTIEPMIGHMKLDGKLGRNHLAAPSATPSTLSCAAPATNLRLILHQLARLLHALLR
jgi:hypothetical protein